MDLVTHPPFMKDMCKLPCIIYVGYNLQKYEEQTTLKELIVGSCMEFSMWALQGASFIQCFMHLIWMFQVK